jgi:hypothetical protein
MGQKMYCIGKKKRKSELGYISEVHRYQAQNCSGCPMRGQCFNGKGERIIELNHKLIEYRKQAKERLTSKEGLYHRSQRPTEPEAVFGQIKYNNRFNRFTLKGLPKIEIEFGLIAISHNLRKFAQKASSLTKNKLFQHFSALYEQLYTQFWQFLIQYRESSI